VCVHFRSSPDCSISYHRSALQGRVAFIYPCESGCGEKRLTGSRGGGNEWTRRKHNDAWDR